MSTIQRGYWISRLYDQAPHNPFRQAQLQAILFPTDAETLPSAWAYWKEGWRKKAAFLGGSTQEYKLLGHLNPPEKWISSSSVFNRCYEFPLLQMAKPFLQSLLHTELSCRQSIPIISLRIKVCPSKLYRATFNASPDARQEAEYNLEHSSRNQRSHYFFSVSFVPSFLLMIDWILIELNDWENQIISYFPHTFTFLCISWKRKNLLVGRVENGINPIVSIA